MVDTTVGELSNYWEEVWEDDYVYYFNEKAKQNYYKQSLFSAKNFKK